MASPDRIAAVHPEVARLFRALGEQRAASTTTARGRAALDALAAEIEARSVRLAQRKDASSHACMIHAVAA